MNALLILDETYGDEIKARHDQVATFVNWAVTPASRDLELSEEILLSCRQLQPGTLKSRLVDVLMVLIVRHIRVT